MTKPPKITVDDLPADIKRQLGVSTRRHTFSKETVRTHALRCLASIADLTQDQRRRVLEHATKLNRI